MSGYLRALRLAKVRLSQQPKVRSQLTYHSGKDMLNYFIGSGTSIHSNKLSQMLSSS